jgi:hypothetical protein
MPTRLGAILIATALVFALAALPAAADTLQFHGQLGPDPSAPPPPSKGSGNASLSLDTTSKTVTWTIEYSGLSGPPVEIGCGVLEAAGPAILVQNNLASPVKGSKALTPADIASLQAGKWICLIGTQKDDSEIGGMLQPAR